MIRVLLVEDSPVVCEFMRHVIESDPALTVIETAVDGQDAVDKAIQLQPDVVLMDVNMPRMDGFLATRRIMETSARPIVLMSASWAPTEVEKTFKALEAGALTVMEKPRGPASPGSSDAYQAIVQMIKIMAEVKVVTRRPAGQKQPANDGNHIRGTHSVTMHGIALVALGASTGGPMVLQHILSQLPRDFPAPVLIVQHIAAGFLPGLQQWLVQTTGYPVHIATHGEPACAGHAYLAPDDFHMGIDVNLRIVLQSGGKDHLLKPSVSHLFRSIAEAMPAHACAVLLTGMGKDGAAELKSLRDRGAVTIAQDKETSIVFGMPGCAVEIDAAEYILPPDQIVQTLMRLVNSYRPEK